MSRLKSSMEDLPAPIVVDILSRLPIKTIIHCRFVCKKWRNLVLDSYFANLHLSRSRAGLLIYYNSEMGIMYYHEPDKAGILKWVELEDELDHHHVRHDPVMSLDLGLAPIFQRSYVSPMGSVNGLICLQQNMREIDNTYVCNPITREYMLLPLPRHQCYRDYSAIVVYGFGVASVIHEYKVIRIFQGDLPPNPPFRPRLIEAEVYTIGTGHWRGLGRAPYCLEGSSGTYLNGHVHWHVRDEDSPEKICVFDLERERFRLFPSPPLEAIEEEDEIYFNRLSVLKGCLCHSHAIYNTDMTLWVMKDYGIKKSWHKQLVIKPSISPYLWTPGDMNVIECLKDGTILMRHRQSLLAYCPKRKTFEATQIFKAEIFRLSFEMPYRPSFLKLRNFESERVNVF